jgi:glycerophosphoryl diester phosphodiesterase
VGVEIDVALTADRQVVLMHDHRLDRTTTCGGCVSQHTLAEIAACEIEPGSDGARPPSLDEALAALSDLPVVPLLMLDVKADPWQDGCPPAGDSETEHLVTLGRSIGRALSDWDYADNTGVQGSSAELLTATRGIAPRATLFSVAGHMEPAVLAARDHELDGVAVWEDGLTDAWVREARGSGLLIDTFTVNTPIDLATAVTSEVDFIESDYVPELLEWFD